MGSACHPCVPRQLPVSAWQRLAWPRGDATAARPHVVVGVAAAHPGGWQQASNGGGKGEGRGRWVRRRCLHALGGFAADAVGRRGAHTPPPRGSQSSATAAVPRPPPLTVPAHPPRASRVPGRVRREEGSPRRWHRWGRCWLARQRRRGRMQWRAARRWWALASLSRRALWVGTARVYVQAIRCAIAHFLLLVSPWCLPGPTEWGDTLRGCSWRLPL